MNQKLYIENVDTLMCINTLMPEQKYIIFLFTSFEIKLNL